MDPDTHAVVDQLFARATSFLGTTTQARMAECSRQTYRNLRLQAAAAAVAHERATWANIEARMGSVASASRVLGGGLRLLSYIEVCSYDGVDFNMQVQHERRYPDRRLPTIGCEDCGEIAHCAADLAVLGRGVHAVQGDASVVVAPMSKLDDMAKKILHSQHVVALTLEHGGQHVCFMSTQLGWLQCSDRTTADTVAPMLLAQSMGTPEFQPQFMRRVRFAITDGAGCNLRAERHIQAKRPTWATLHICCLTHVVVGANRKTIDTLKPVTTGFISWARSLSQGVEVVWWRTALRTVLRRQLVIKEGALCASALAYTEAVVKTFLDGADHRDFIACLALCANGD
jgi:hypothetical protein